MDCFVKNIKEGIVRISGHDNMPENYLERYGIVNIPKPDGTSCVKLDENSVTLKNGRKIEFDIRCKNEIWENEEKVLLQRFKKYIPEKLSIEGRPTGEPIDVHGEADGTESLKKFGISFKLTDKDNFYGLGEGGRDKIQLRGSSYQNWTVYQYNEIPIPFVMSSDNWGIFINAQGRNFVDIDDIRKGYLTVLGNFDELDIFLIYGGSMKEILSIYTDITGKSAVLPKWAYGLTYIAGIHQNQFEILNDMKTFREKHIPCDTVSLEPGWMENIYDFSFEKGWNKEKFHIDCWMRSRDCQYTFPSALRRYGFHLMLWLCMNYDLCDYEEYLISGKLNIPPWYEHIKQFVNDGADGFKMDPSDMVMRINPNKIYTNGKSELEMHNVSQVLVAKHMNSGFCAQMNKRPFIHYCGGYTGQQRWGAATTGDNGGLEGAMIWIENLAMSGFTNTTVDMDIYSIEAMHFAFLAPWAHHNAWAGCGQPWFAGDENEKAYTFYAKLRYRLIPYIYSLALECFETGVPIIRPMPLEYQSDENCLNLSKQYMLGEYILISAFTDKVYLPQGEWIDYWTGVEYKGNITIENYVPPKGRGGAFFIKKGAIIPQWCERDYTSQYSEEKIQLHIYPGKNSEFIFREDDGESLDYLENNLCRTKIRCFEENGILKILIGGREGDYKGKPAQRIWEVYIHENKIKTEVLCASEDKVIIKNAD